MAEPNKLSRAAAAAIDRADAVGVSPLSAWEAAMLVERGRLELDRDPVVWIRQALAVEGISVLPLHPRAAVSAARLDGRAPADPVDRLLLATARHERCVLVTKDRHLRAYDATATLW